MEDDCAEKEKTDKQEMEIQIKDEFIRLGQALKLAGAVSSGIEAKILIADGLVKVNGETETRRGKKLRDGDTVLVRGETFTVRASE